MTLILFIQFFLAHLIGDFFIQPNKWVKDKERNKWKSPYLYLHIVVHFALILMVTMSFAYWRQALIIASTHLVIDAAKLQFQNEKTKRHCFFIDQALHLITLFFVWFWSTHNALDLSLLKDTRLWVIAVAVLFLLKPVSFLIKVVISKWSPTQDKHHPEALEDVAAASSLVKAGQLIGYMERLLVLTFILVGKWEGVGFLMAAKSVFRFGDLKEAKDMKLTEYVLIGTFLSFGIAVFVGIVAHFLFNANGY